jgi:hypothetical protein
MQPFMLWSGVDGNGQYRQWFRLPDACHSVNIDVLYIKEALNKSSLSALLVKSGRSQGVRRRS